ncbi:hypothetical protein M9458_021180, partial [Cirrhinus mrigala]
MAVYVTTATYIPMSSIISSTVENETVSVLTGPGRHGMEQLSKENGLARYLLFWIGANYHHPVDLNDTTGLCWREAIIQCLESIRCRSRTTPDPEPNPPPPPAQSQSPSPPQMESPCPP